MPMARSRGRAAPALERIALFDYGFRPFFLAAGAYGALSILAWVCTYWGALALPIEWPGVLWHGHEMVFGFAAAGLAGFMLTAVPNWTGERAERGAMLLALSLVWLAGRVVLWVSAVVPAPAVALIDLAFIPSLGAVVGRGLLAGLAKTGPRNLIFLALLALFWSGDLLTHLDALGICPGIALTGLHLGIDVLLLAITIVGGRIIPAFTANALRKAGSVRLPRAAAPLDAAAILSMAVFLVVDVALGSGRVLGAVALLAAALNGVRLALWRPLSTLRDPLLAVLHLGYGWLVLGLLLSAAAGLSEGEILAPTAALHALTAGAIGTMLLAVMSRAALGHTGRPLVASPPTVAAYALLSLGAALRIVAPLLGSSGTAALAAAGALWALAMILFTAVHAPILTRARADSLKS